MTRRRGSISEEIGETVRHALESDERTVRLATLIMLIATIYWMLWL